MEICASGEGLSVGLQGVLLGLEKRQIIGSVVEDLGLFEFDFFALLLH